MRLTIRQPTAQDIPGMALIFERDTGRKLSDKAADRVERYPAAVAVHQESIVGFCYSKPFAPDILEITNLFIIEAHRGNGLGKQLLEAVEAKAFVEYKATVLVNSTLYPSKGGKRLATSFYLCCGYTEILATENSKVFCKKAHSWHTNPTAMP